MIGTKIISYRVKEKVSEGRIGTEITCTLRSGTLKISPDRLIENLKELPLFKPEVQV